MQQSLAGLSVGDAFGERFFGLPDVMVERIRRREVPHGPWAWTDDTAMALSIVEVLEAHGRIDGDALARLFARRFLDQPGRGYGRAAFHLLGAIGVGEPWAPASQALFGGLGSKGNGGAMRVAPLGAFFADDLPRVVEEAALSARVTHAHPEGQAGAIAVAVSAALVVRGASGEALLGGALEHTPPGATRAGLEAAARLPFSTRVEDAAAALGSGREVLAEDTVPFALWCAARHLESFEEAMWQTVAGLGDRDTTCAIVGGIVALRSLPPAKFVRLREPLRW